MISKKFSIGIVIVLVCFFNVVYGQNFKGASDVFNIDESLRQLKIGEQLVYSLEWLGVPIGWITLDVKEIVFIENNPCYHIVARAKPNRFFQKIYNVEYIVHTYIDAKNFYSRRFQKFKYLDKKVTEIRIDFNHDKNEAIYMDLLSKKSIPIRALSCPHDLLSSLYYFRLDDIKRETSYNMDILYGIEKWKVNTKVGKTFILDIRKLGVFKVFSVKLSTELSKIILGRREIEVYFTTDSYRIPVKFFSYSLFGYITGILTNIPTSNKGKRR